MIKRFIKFFLKNALIAVVSTSFAFIIILMVIVSLIASVAQKQPSFPSEAILSVDLTMNIIDTPPSLTLQEMLKDAIGDDYLPEYNIRDLMETIERAKNDRRIKALLLQGSFQPMEFGCSFPALSELKDVLQDFQTSGKPIIAYSVNPSLRDLYVMSVADEFYLNRAGSVMIPGLYSENMYYKNAFDKFGIGVQAVRVGEFKSAVEPYTRSGMSDEARKASESLLNDLWQQIISEITTSRHMDEQATIHLIDNHPILFAKEAVEAGFCDGEKTHIEVRDRLAEITGKDPDTQSFKRISLDQYILEKEQFKHHPSGDGIAVVYAEGAIVGGQGENYEAGAERIVQNLRDARTNPDVKAIVFRVNSPGGGATASKIIQDELLEIKAQNIPLIVSMGGYAASGGYLISESADRIFCHPNTITGSIGIFGLLMHVGEGAGKLGITFDEVKTARNADIQSIAKPKTDEQIALIQDYLNDFYMEWTELAAEFRGQTVEHIRSIASGRVWSGNQAEKIGLIDELGGLQDAINFAAQKAQLGDRCAVYDYPRKLTEDEAIASALGFKQARISVTANTSGPALQLKHWLRQLEKVMTQFNDPMGAYALSPVVYE